MSTVKFVLQFIAWWIGLVLAASIVAIFVPSESVFFGVFSVFVVFGAPVLAFFLVRRSRRRATQNAAEPVAKEKREIENADRRRFLERERLLKSVDAHSVALTRNLNRSLTRNDYGKLVDDKTDEAISEFLSSISLDHSVLSFETAKELVFEQLDFRRSEELSQGFDPESLPFDGSEFEHWVASALTKFGWHAEVTQASGDQGVDVIAEKDSVRIAIQCKLYSSAVGNKAVQEVHTGAVYHKANLSAVLTNSGFTQSAVDLAEMTGVLLLSHRDIPRLSELVAGKSGT